MESGLDMKLSLWYGRIFTKLERQIYSFNTVFPDFHYWINLSEAKEKENFMFTQISFQVVEIQH